MSDCDDGIEEENETKFAFFGNCAENDVIRTANSDGELDGTKDTDNCIDFKSACEYDENTDFIIFLQFLLLHIQGLKISRLPQVFFENTKYNRDIKKCYNL